MSRHRNSGMPGKMSRRRFVTGVAAGGAWLGLGMSARAGLAGRNPVPLLRGNRFNLDVGYLDVDYTGRRRIATAINGSVPGPTLRWREGETVTLNVTNRLAHDSSIHWHGMILPANMDGVPGISFHGIRPGETFTYRFDVRQSGTYWYHSHSEFQEQTGLYGAIVIDPAGPDPIRADRDYVVLLSDWSDEAPERIYAKLKKKPDYYNYRERTAADLWRDLRERGIAGTADDRAMWNRMRMSDRDLADVTGHTYTYLMNGLTPEDRWTGLFRRGERARLRFINAAAMTLFDVRIPGLSMTVVAADGQDIEPVTVDEFRIGVAETYDVVVEPSHDSAYTIFAQSIDRSGYALGSLTPDADLHGEVPAMDPPALLGHRDMGMDHGSQIVPAAEQAAHQGHAMSAGSHAAHSKSGRPGMSGFGSIAPILHSSSEFGPHVDMRAESPPDGVNDPGVGLREHLQRYGRRVLTYADIRNLASTPDPREHSREIVLHLTGNMSRYMWSMDGVRFADAEPLRFAHGERLRITLVNDTMMTHPVHLHGMWSDLETGDAKRIPRKHTVIVQPGSKISYLVTADARGEWAYHCHLLYHMPGMFRKVVVA